MMTTTLEEYKWYVNLVRERHQALNLTFEQAEKVYKYEQDKDHYSDKHYFSVWEDYDYELSEFKEILNDEQYKNYECIYHENIRCYEQTLKEQDKEKLNEIAYHKELINYYENHFLPDFFKALLLPFGLLLHVNKSKIEYIKTEYKSFLNDTKKELLTNHFRHNRTFKPNELKSTLLQHKLSYLFPDYSAFKHKMDEPTQAIVHFLNSKLSYLSDNFEKLLTQKFDELKSFDESLFKKYYSETERWQIVIEKKTKEEQKEHHLMTLLLLDNNKYGC